MMQWYVVFVETGKEDIVQTWLKFHFGLSIYSFIPKRKLVEKRKGQAYEVIKKVFPGYVFLRINQSVIKDIKLKRIPHIIRFLQTGTNYSVIEEAEMQIITRLVNSNDVIDFTTVLIEDSKVVIQEGPLSGIEAIIKKIDKHRQRAKVLLYILGEQKIVDIGIKILYRSPST